MFVVLMYAATPYDIINLLYCVYFSFFEAVPTPAVVEAPTAVARETVAAGECDVSW